MSQKDLGVTSLLHITCVFPRSHLFWNAFADLNRFHSIHGIMWFVAVWTLGTTHKHEAVFPLSSLCVFRPEDAVYSSQVKRGLGCSGELAERHNFILIRRNAVLFSIHLTWYVCNIYLFAESDNKFFKM